MYQFGFVITCVVISCCQGAIGNVVCKLTCVVMSEVSQMKCSLFMCDECYCKTMFLDICCEYLFYLPEC